eukprot:17933-Chlamydomonas_euryale.AAC.4
MAAAAAAAGLPPLLRGGTPLRAAPCAARAEVRRSCSRAPRVREKAATTKRGSRTFRSPNMLARYSSPAQMPPPPASMEGTPPMSKRLSDAR